MPSDSHRLTILTAEEIEDLFGFPHFNVVRRDRGSQGLNFSILIPGISDCSPNVKLSNAANLWRFALATAVTLSTGNVPRQFCYVLKRPFTDRLILTVQNLACVSFVHGVLFVHLLRTLARNKCHDQHKRNHHHPYR